MLIKTITACICFLLSFINDKYCTLSIEVSPVAGWLPHADLDLPRGEAFGAHSGRTGVEARDPHSPTRGGLPYLHERELRTDSLQRFPVWLDEQYRTVHAPENP